MYDNKISMIQLIMRMMIMIIEMSTQAKPTGIRCMRLSQSFQTGLFRASLVVERMSVHQTGSKLSSLVQ